MVTGELCFSIIASLLKLQLSRTSCLLILFFLFFPFLQSFHMLFSDANRLDGHTRFEASNLVIQILLPVHYYVPVCPIINLTEHAFHRSSGQS
jgi:hypothetical protein